MPEFSTLDSLFPADGSSPVIAQARADAGIKSDALIVPDAAGDISLANKDGVAVVSETKLEQKEAPAELASQADSKPAEVKPSPLAEKIKADREARQARAAQVTEIDSYKKQLAERDAQIAAFKSQEDPIADPVGWAKARGLSKEEQALFAESLLYDLVPDKAPVDQRIKLFEAKQAREARLSKEREAKQAEEAKAAQFRQAIESYTEEVEASVANFTEGSFPESESWFGDNSQAYVQALVTVARNKADEAAKRGMQADLSVEVVARALEQDISDRMSRREKSRAARSIQAKPETKQTAPVVQQKTVEAIDTVSGDVLGGGAMPRQPAKTEEERRQRAIEAVFGR